MYKNFNAEILDISGRQSEIIELALTYGFKGLQLDMDEFVKRCQRSSYESAARFVESAKLKIGGFSCPIDLDADDETFATKVAQLNGVAEVAGRCSAEVGIINVPGQTDRLPYPEYFDVVRQRIDQIAEIFAKENVKIALSLNALPESEEKQFKFIKDVEGFIALLKACTSSNVYAFLDSWNWFCGGGTDEQVDQLGIEKIAALQLSDCREGVAAASATAEDRLLPCSTGVIDNVSILKRFATTEMKLPVTAAGAPASPAGTRDALVSAAQDSLDKAFEEAGLPYVTRKPELFVPEPLYPQS